MKSLHLTLVLLKTKFKSSSKKSISDCKYVAFVVDDVDRAKVINRPFDRDHVVAVAGLYDLNEIKMLRHDRGFYIGNIREEDDMLSSDEDDDDDSIEQENFPGPQVVKPKRKRAVDVSREVLQAVRIKLNPVGEQQVENTNFCILLDALQLAATKEETDATSMAFLLSSKLESSRVYTLDLVMNQLKLHFPGYSFPPDCTDRKWIHSFAHDFVNNYLFSGGELS
jgi:hypothetical protein